MAEFFIDTDRGQVATLRQLVEAGIASETAPPPRPWLRIQGTRDATTMWYAVMRKRERGIFIGTLVLRHSDHHASLLGRGWDEVPIEQIAAVAP
jgi:alpha/beta superfamily hydrolase